MKYFLTVILALGLVFLGCNSGTDDDDDDDKIGDTDGRLTLTGLSGYNGFDVIAFGGIQGESGEFIAVEGFSDSNDIVGGKVSDEKVTLNVWTAADEDAKPVSYRGNDQGVHFLVFVINYTTVDENTVKLIRERKSDLIIRTGVADADFTDGIGEAAFLGDLMINF